MQDFQIVRIRKPNVNSSHEHITHVQTAGGTSWTRNEVINAIDSGNRFYVSVGGATAYVQVVRNGPNAPYIKTHPDSTGKDNLLSLPQF